MVASDWSSLTSLDHVDKASVGGGHGDARHQGGAWLLEQAAHHPLRLQPDRLWGKHRDDSSYRCLSEYKI